MTVKDAHRGLADQASRHALLVVTTSRPEFANPWSDRARVIALSGLGRLDIAAVTDMVLKGRRLAAGVVQLIVERTDGVPLFVEELTRMLLETHLVAVDGELVLKTGTELSTIPTSIRDSLVGRLERLGAANQTAQLAAAIGREFTRDLLLAATTRSQPDAERDLQNLLDADLVIRRLGGDRERFLFRHALIRDAAYEMLTSAGRRRVHKQIAGALERQFPDAVRADPGVLARHLFEAGSYHSATDYGIRATRLALEQSAFDEAISRSRTVLAWLKELPETDRADAELTVNSILTPSLMNKFGWAAKELGDTVSRSLEILDTAGDSPYRVPTLWWVVMNRLVAGKRGTLAELTRQLRAMSRRSGDPGDIAASEALVGFYDYTQGDCEAGRRAMQLALDTYDPVLHRDSGATYGFDIRVFAGAALARVMWDLGECREATRVAQGAVDWARELQHVPSLGIALMYQSIVHQYNGEKREVGEVSGELLKLSRQYGLMVYAAYGTLLHCWAKDDPTGGEDAFALLEARSRHGTAFYYSLLSDIDHRHGRSVAALARIDRCIGLCRSLDEHYYEPHLHLRRARYLQADPAHDRWRAQQDLRTALRLASAQGAARVAELARGLLASTE